MKLHEIYSHPDQFPSQDNTKQLAPIQIWMKNRTDRAALTANEAIFATDPECAYRYAKMPPKGAFPAGEAAIATSAKHSFDYAYYVLRKKPFPLGEKAIATDGIFACQYARLVLRGPFPLGEKAIATRGRESYTYAVMVLNKPFPAGEEAMKKSYPSGLDEDAGRTYHDYYIETDVYNGRPPRNTRDGK